MMTLLEAVNKALLGVRESPVNSLNTALPRHARLAYNAVLETKRDVLAAGWKFNTDRDVTLAIDGNGNITMGTDVLQVKFDPARNSSAIDPVLRGPTVYDLESASYVFTGSVYALEVVRNLDWVLLPHSCRNYIALRAAREFQAKVLGSSPLNQTASREEILAFQEFARENNKAGRPPNMLYSPGIRDIAFRRGTWL